VMDTNDEIVLGDIADLWAIFAEFDDDDLIGSVLEQTEHYKRFSNRQHQHYDPNWNDPNPVCARACVCACVCVLWRDTGPHCARSTREWLPPVTLPHRSAITAAVGYG